MIGPIGFNLQFFYFLDNSLVGPFFTARDAQKASDQKFEEELNRILMEVIHPALMVKAKWQELARQVPNWTDLLNTVIPTDETS